MDFGISWFATDEVIQPDEMATLVEERGFESLFVPEHTHIPASRATPYPAGTDLPSEYWHTYDPFVALATIAARTKRLKVGAAISAGVTRARFTPPRGRAR